LPIRSEGGNSLIGRKADHAQGGAALLHAARTVFEDLQLERVVTSLQLVKKHDGDGIVKPAEFAERVDLVRLQIQRV